MQNIRLACPLLLLASALLTCSDINTSTNTPPSAPPDGTWFISVGMGIWERIDAFQDPGVPGIYELTRYPDATPNPEQQARADELLRHSLEAAQRNGWFDYEQGLAAGFHLKPTLDVLHYAHDDFLRDDRLLDPERPEFLMYYDTPNGKKLAGVMDLARTLVESGPQIGGPLTIWHYHIWAKPMCWEAGIPIGEPDRYGACAEGVFSIRSPEMIHVWFMDHPQGPFATAMTLTPDLIEQLANDHYPGSD